MSELPRIETVLFLQSVDFFSACTAEQILRISAIVHQRRLTTGEKVYGPGEPAAELFCVVEGAVEPGNRGSFGSRSRASCDNPNNLLSSLGKPCYGNRCR